MSVYIFFAFHRCCNTAAGEKKTQRRTLHPSKRRKDGWTEDEALELYKYYVGGALNSLQLLSAGHYRYRSSFPFSVWFRSLPFIPIGTCYLAPHPTSFCLILLLFFFWPCASSTSDLRRLQPQKPRAVSFYNLQRCTEKEREREWKMKYATQPVA